jgi:hypothetical protein
LSPSSYRRLPQNTREAEEYLGIELTPGAMNNLDKKKLWKFNEELEELAV